MQESAEEADEETSDDERVRLLLAAMAGCRIVSCRVVMWKNGQQEVEARVMKRKWFKRASTRRDARY